ncbi:YhdT family protein [Indiicoccus explosivorum]|uniref:YhdT family protein n=1 Tax=Indiicoccus explosivorum TaxID=1917864 RepID=UPI000B447CD3|nr:YhdT family protein [Indiicoccus explosivorum]
METPKSKDDWRFKIANREALIGVALAVINFVWWFGFAYGMGSGDVEEYSYVFGLPAWFFYSCVLGLAVMIVLVALTVKFFFRDIPFEDGEEER